jgi:hypothetical protein
MRRTSFLALAATLATFVFVSPIAAQGNNKNAFTLHFTCTDNVSFTAETIFQNQAIVDIVTGGANAATFVYTNITRTSDGAVFYNVPGLSNKSTVTCTVAEIPGFTFTGFFVPPTG